ncbi:hypothetical protein MBLNU13_g00334t1 [Cladosporium sp. NU13]
MYHQKSKLGSSLLNITTPIQDPFSRFDKHHDETYSPLSSTCVRSTSSQDPVLSRGELIRIMTTISTFALHYAAVYHAIACSYHALPFSARRSEWVVSDMRCIVDLAFNASHYKQLPDLVYIFSEISLRLYESQYLLGNYPGKWQDSEKLLRRCDALMQEAEVRLKFLQDGVWNMWFIVDKDEKVCFDESEDCNRARSAFRDRWLSSLPQICFAGQKREKELQDEMKESESRSERRWVSWSG